MYMPTSAPVRTNVDILGFIMTCYPIRYGISVSEMTIDMFRLS